MPTEYDGGVLLLESARQLHVDDDGGGGGGDDDERDFDVDNKAGEFEDDNDGWDDGIIESRWVKQRRQVAQVLARQVAQSSQVPAVGFKL